ncbi:hypothetical protein M8C21_007116 [Ambrosia artemisiifolia]|uniref:Uncharacterized protein n=1 Tax=Ambrosia artemisiifolia TaxID=4212 RepID=A0AAD5CWP6_AMBAR|nr:hypothetical protein M8C21_007116 [Ambrosia artemisiifolia]
MGDLGVAERQSFRNHSQDRGFS